MKTNKQKLFKTFMFLAIASATFTGAMANDENYLNSDPININGYVAEEVEPTDGELERVKQELKTQKNAIKVTKTKKKKYNELSRTTEKLSDEMEDMIGERKESQQNIDKFNKKIDCLMAEGDKDGCDEFVKSDKVSSRQAAPKVEKHVQASHHNDEFGKNFKVLPYLGFTTIMTDQENLEANASVGAKVESNINSRFSVGVGFAYTTMTTEDFGGNNYFGGGWDPRGYDSFYGGREIQYSNLNFNIYSKFFILKNDRFRPYVGAGLGYNRTTLAYSNNNSYPGNAGFGYGSGYGAYGYGNENFGNEEVLTSNINAELMVGTEIIFTEMIGMNVEFNYQRALGGNISTRNGIDYFQAPDQQRLEDLSDEIGDANILSLFAGMLIQF